MDPVPLLQAANPGLVLLAPTWHANPTPTPQGKVRPHEAHSLKQWPICCAQSHSTPAHPPPATQRPFIAHHWPRESTQRPPSCSSCIHSTGCLPALCPGVRRLFSGSPRGSRSPCPSLASPVNPQPLPVGLTPTSRLFSSRLGLMLAPLGLGITLDVEAILGSETEAQRGKVTCLGSHS